MSVQGGRIERLRKPSFAMMQRYSLSAFVCKGTKKIATMLIFNGKMSAPLFARPSRPAAIFFVLLQSVTKRVTTSIKKQ